MSTSRHPKGLYLIFATSTAERFSYYGMRAIFILFLTQALLFDKEHAASIYGQLHRTGVPDTLNRRLHRRQILGASAVPSSGEP